MIRLFAPGFKGSQPRLIAKPLLILAPAAPSPQPLILNVESPVRRTADTWRRPGREEAEDPTGLSELFIGELGADLAAGAASFLLLIVIPGFSIYIVKLMYRVFDVFDNPGLLLSHSGTIWRKWDRSGVSSERGLYMPRMRCRAISAYSGLISMRMNRRPSRRATCPTIPLPPNGSRTTPFWGHPTFTIGSMSLGGKVAKWAPGNGAVGIRQMSPGFLPLG